MSARAAAPDPARAAAYEVLRRTFEHGAWTDRAFPAAAERHGLEGRARPRAQWLSYGAVQRRGTSDALIGELGRRDAGELDGPVVAALRLGLFELLFADRPADHAVVGDAVELAKRGMRPRGERRATAAAGLVNALLRRAARDRQRLLERLDDRDPSGAALAHSLPGWLVRMWWSELGAEATRSLGAAANRELPTALRVNPLRAEPGLAARLAAMVPGALLPDRDGGRVPPLWPSEAVVVPGELAAAVLGALAASEVHAQSLGAQAVVEILDPQPGERVLDLCAGPGLKTVAIAGRMRDEGEIVAVERDPGRARQIRELAASAGARSVRVVEGDAREDVAGQGYDRVLVDPPCSDLGTLASRPDARWRKSEAAIRELAELQRGVLARGRAATRPGGALVYSTCTISWRENEEVVATTLGQSPGVQADDLGAASPGLASSHDPRFLQTRPDRDATDGFFIARLCRSGG